MLTHHAYYLEGSAKLLPELASSLSEEEMVLPQEYERFGIDDAHALQYQAALKSGERQIFVIATPSMTTEAQQALLKLFEEPQEGVIFMLLVPHGILLPTLRSRCLPFPLRIEVSPHAGGAREFLRATNKERSEMVAALLKDEDGARERARELLAEVERLLYAELQKAKDKKELIAGLGEIETMRTYLGDRSPSLKMILEHLAAALPKV